MKKLFCFIFLTCTITACTAPAERVMDPLQYKEPVKAHSSKKAYLYWQPGTQYSSIAPPDPVASSSITEAILSSLIESEMRSANPNRYTYTYGKAQQAVFMTSLKNVLEENHVFKDVAITTDLNEVNPSDVLIKIYFKSTRVLGHEKNYQIVLNVNMAIQTKTSKFEHTYLVESDDSGFFSMKSFKDQQTDASQKLLSKVIDGITQWNTHSIA